MQVFAKRFYCPDLVSQEDGVMIQETLQNAPGIEDSEVDHVAHTVWVATASQDGFGVIIDMLRDAGFPPEEMEAAI